MNFLLIRDKAKRIESQNVVTMPENMIENGSQDSQCNVSESGISPRLSGSLKSLFLQEVKDEPNRTIKTYTCKESGKSVFVIGTKKPNFAP